MKQAHYKHIWYAIIKLTIVFGAGYYVYTRTFLNEDLDTKLFFSQLDDYLFQNWKLFFFLVGFSLLNWFLEIKKWQNLANLVRPVSFYQALKQSLSSHTLSLITPFKVGEYGGKAIYYTKYERKRIVLLNFIGNAAQLFVTIFFGIIGLVFFLKSFDVSINIYKLRRMGYLLAFLIAMIFAGTKVGRNNKAGYYQKAMSFFHQMDWKTKGRTLVLSFFRYVVFSHQFYMLLVLFRIEIPYETAMFLVFAMYFLATLFPVFSLLDFVIKGSIAIYLFSFLGIDEVKIMTISTLMWLLNFALPALVGSYYVLSFKSNFSTKFA